MPKLLATQKQAGSDVRVMLTSSEATYRFQPKGGLRLEEMKSKAESMHTSARYGHSKLANSLFARKLAQVYPNITTTSHHPGQYIRQASTDRRRSSPFVGTVASEIFGKADGLGSFLSTLAKPFVMLMSVSTDKGAESGLWTAFVDKSQLKNGDYYEPVGINKSTNKNLNDQKLADQLWEYTNKELAQHGGPGWSEQ